MELQERLYRALNKLAKWRNVFAGWQVGTTTSTDEKTKAIKDHREVTMLMRAEISALTKVLIDKGVFTVEEFETQLLTEAEHLDKEYEKKFPGFYTEEYGVRMDAKTAAHTTRNWAP